MASSPPRGKDISAKIVVLGESAVGKSSLALRFVRREFLPNQEATIGAAFLSRTVAMPNGVSIKFEIWDTAGQERYRALAPMYYRGAAGAIIVYDITNQDSLRKASQWIEELRNNADPSTVVALVGNKSDLESLRIVGRNVGEQLAQQSGAPIFCEVSAKDGQNVDSLFVRLGETMLELGVIGQPETKAQPKQRVLDPPGARSQQQKKRERCEC